MSNHAETANDIPDAAFYVTMTDSFMSDWGPAEGKSTVYVALCDNEREAEIVKANAEAREDQENPEIKTVKPLPGEGQHMMLMSREDSARWYEEGAF